MTTIERDVNDESLRALLRAVEGILRDVGEDRRLALIQRALERYQRIVDEMRTPVRPGCVRFELLPLGTVFTVGDAFSEAQTTVTVGPLRWGNGISTSVGTCRVDGRSLAGGAGQDLEVNNSTAEFAFAGVVTRLTMQFGEYGGSLNLRVNGRPWNFDNFSALPGPALGGVAVSATVNPVHRGEQGTLELTGRIFDFAVGGQELWVDDVCYE